jgi:DNA-3-methyladenine glycosylase
MRDTFGHLYIYSIYGMHRCLNFTTDEHGIGAVLIRALEPLEGIAAMRRRRGVRALEDLCSGPAKVVQALGIDPALDGKPVADHFELTLPSRPVDLATSPRIGLSRAQDLPWRFFARGNRFVSAGRASVTTEAGVT